MTASERPRVAWVVGPGRVGRALGSMLAERGGVGEVAYVGKAPGARSPTPAGGPVPPDLVLVTVRDDQIAGVAADLSDRDLPPAVALHTSGALDSTELAGLAEKGWATGSMAPVVSIADPARDAGKLVGAWFAVEGDPIAVATARTLIAALDGRALHLPRDAKPVYHAAAVFASNYVVTLMAVAERLMGDAGVGEEEARAALSALAAGAIANAGQRGAETALTGPVSRGDAATISRHLARLSPSDRRLYSVLAQETLEVARRRGLDPALADAIARILEKAAAP